MSDIQDWDNMQISHTLIEVPKLCTDWAGFPIGLSAGSKVTVLSSHINVFLMIRHCSLHTEKIKAAWDICLSLCFIDKRGGNTKYSFLEKLFLLQLWSDRQRRRNGFLHPLSYCSTHLPSFLTALVSFHMQPISENPLWGHEELP